MFSELRECSLARASRHPTESGAYGTMQHVIGAPEVLGKQILRNALPVKPNALLQILLAAAGETRVCFRLLVSLSHSPSPVNTTGLNEEVHAKYVRAAI